MNVIDQTQFVERLRFFDGQRLEAYDLQTIETFHREMRWLHNRSLHQPGVGNGLTVSGSKGDSVVTISPGYAIDDYGREIVLTQPLVEAVPPVAGVPGENTTGKPQAAQYALTLSYPSDQDLEESVVQTRAGVCAPRGAIRLREKPVVCWIPLVEESTDMKPEAGFTLDDKVILAQVGVLNCKLDSIDMTMRRSIQPPQLPYVSCGRVKFPPNSKRKDAGDFERFQATVEVGEAGFRTTPRFLVRIEDALEKESEREKDVFLPKLVNVTYTSATQFRFDLYRPKKQMVPRETSPIVAETPAESDESLKRLWIVWIGVEGSA